MTTCKPAIQPPSSASSVLVGANLFAEILAPCGRSHAICCSGELIRPYIPINCVFQVYGFFHSARNPAYGNADLFGFAVPAQQIRHCLRLAEDFFAEVEKLCEAQSISTGAVDDKET